jgi:hypothetical protein
VDLYTAEKLFLERRREVTEAVERRQRLMSARGTEPRATRVWVAARLRALADWIEARPRLQQV